MNKPTGYKKGVDARCTNIIKRVSLFHCITHKKTNIMSEWISVEEAAKKYNLKKEYIQLWVDMRVIMSYFKDYKTVVNDESLRGFLKTREKGIDPEYVKALEQFCISKSETCLIYAFLLGARDKELEMYREAKSQRDALRGMWMEQNERVRDLEIELE